MNTRHRPIDPGKNISLVKDIQTMEKEADASNKAEIESFEKEIKRILSLYDSKKSIIIPKTELIQNKKDEKQPNKNNKKENEQNKFETAQGYTLKEYIRPEGYIIYSEKQREENNKKDYEASRHDLNFLTFENYFNGDVKLVDLENIISLIENKIGVGDPISQEKAISLVSEMEGEKFKKYAERIVKGRKFFNLFYLIYMIKNEKIFAFDYKKFFAFSLSSPEEKNLKNLY